MPLSNVKGCKTDRDSVEEYGINLNHLSKNQLLLNVHVELNISHGNVSVGITDSLVNETVKQND